jgi:hypothetical protein
MKKFKIIAGIMWAFLCLVLVLVLFPGLNSFSGSFARLPFMKINPNYSGGEVVNHIISANYVTDIRKPVFDGLTGQRKRGFVQIDWRGKIPDVINDTIDYDMDNKADFRIHIFKDGSSTEIEPINKKIGKVLVSTPTSYGWAVRVEVQSSAPTPEFPLP